MDIATLERDLAAKQSEGLALLKSTAETAEAEDRLMTEEERNKIKAITADGQAIQARIARLRGDETMLAELNRLTATAQSPTGPGRAPRPQSWGEMFVRSEAFQFFKAGSHRTQSAWRSPSIELPWPTGFGGIPMLRATTLTEDPASGGALIIPDYRPGIYPLPQAPLLVAELFAQGTTSSNLITYMREKTWTNAAATVLEGGIKPESTLVFEAASDPVRKIAHWLPVSEEMLEDEPQIRSYIDARLRQGVLTEEQDQILNGTGVAPDILGLLKRTGLAPAYPLAAGQSNADAMLAQAMAIFASSFLMPDAFVMNPTDWSNTLLSKTSTGQYYTGGPFSPIQQPTLWGLPVAVTPATPAGTGITGAFKTGAQIFRKGGVRVEASNSHADFFIKNLVAIRAEERLALAVYRPGAFGEVTGLSPVVVP
jgi:HK97 family phage major capsid protein